MKKMMTVTVLSAWNIDPNNIKNEQRRPKRHWFAAAIYGGVQIYSDRLVDLFGYASKRTKSILNWDMLICIYLFTYATLY